MAATRTLSSFWMHHTFVLIWLASALLVSAACASESADRNTWPRHTAVFDGPVEYHAQVQPVPGTASRLRAELVVRNPGPDTVRGEYGPCSFALRAYEVDEVAGPPVWDDRPHPAAVCEDIAYLVRIAPGAARTIQVERSSPKRLIRPGRYRFRIALKDQRDPAVVREIPAGELRLGR